ncbi:MAG: ATP-binding protein [Bdellovibrio sp. CG10_big_fil_rev_8_21_14_0_10_47_8]|nr:MAG: ATP-binding protein [Bdellovibrio sp. CG10_big_fil_rev_8_21_14_0_10_47_8]
MSPQIWVVAAGKGGVGKTFISSSLGITLSKLNHKVLLVDFDISGANLHTTFGQAPCSKNLSAYFNDSESLVNLIQTTQVPKLSIIQGFWDSWHQPDISQEQTRKLITDCRSLPFDYVVFDLGPGPSAPHLELFSQANERILVSNSEPTSVEKNYRFIEAFICQSLRPSFNSDGYEKLVGALKEYRTSQKSGYFSFRNHLKSCMGCDFNFFDDLDQKPIRLIINSSRSRLDQDLGHSIKSVCHKYYDFPVDYVGAVDFDNAVWQSVKTKEPVLIEKPFTPLAGEFLSICKHLTNPNLHANVFRAVI